MDLTLRDGVNLQQAIQVAKDIDQQSKQSGFNQHALDQMARQGYSNARFEVNAEEGLDLVEEFYAESPQQQDQKKVNDLTQWKDIQKGLQESVQTLN